MKDRVRDLTELTEREYFALVGRRPGMFVGTPSFHMLAAFFTGYDQHATRHGGDGLRGWEEWLLARLGYECAHAWPGRVLHLALPDGWTDYRNLPPAEEQRAIEVLFELLDAYAAEREAARNAAGGT